jgi:hypothetical protein
MQVLELFFPKGIVALTLWQHVICLFRLQLQCEVKWDLHIQIILIDLDSAVQPSYPQTIGVLLDSLSPSLFSLHAELEALQIRPQLRKSIKMLSCCVI